jgi:hypothetical protein
MILDERSEFADAVSVAAAAGTALIGDVIDTQVGALNATLNPGNGQPLYFIINIDTSIVTGGVAGTVQFALMSDSTADLNTSPTTHFLTAAYATGATGTAGSTLAGSTPVMVALPQGSYERYLGVKCITATTTTTAGKINAFLTPDPASWRAYADAVN